MSTSSPNGPPPLHGRSVAPRPARGLRQGHGRRIRQARALQVQGLALCGYGGGAL